MGNIIIILRFALKQDSWTSIYFTHSQNIYKIIFQKGGTLRTPSGMQNHAISCFWKVKIDTDTSQTFINQGFQRGVRSVPSNLSWYVLRYTHSKGGRLTKLKIFTRWMISLAYNNSLLKVVFCRPL